MNPLNSILLCSYNLLQPFVLRKYNFVNVYFSIYLTYIGINLRPNIYFFYLLSPFPSSYILALQEKQSLQEDDVFKPHNYHLQGGRMIELVVWLSKGGFYLQRCTMLQSIPTCMCALNPPIIHYGKKPLAFTKLTIRKTSIHVINYKI
jgi:hypothetical protein